MFSPCSCSKSLLLSDAGVWRPTSNFSQVTRCPALEASCSEWGSLERCPQSRHFEGRSSSKCATGHRTRRCTEPCVTVATAIAAFGSCDGPEVTMLRETMKKAQRAAPEPPNSNQVKGCEDFIARAEKRLVFYDQQRSKLSDLEDGRNRLQKLRAVAEIALQTPSSCLRPLQIGKLRFGPFNKWSTRCKRWARVFPKTKPKLRRACRFRVILDGVVQLLGCRVGRRPPQDQYKVAQLDCEWFLHGAGCPCAVAKRLPPCVPCSFGCSS